MKVPTSPEGKYRELKRRLDDYIRSEKMRQSNVRDLLLQKVCELQQPFTAGQLVEAAIEAEISQGSAYNVLQLFQKARILHTVNRDSTREHARYQILFVKSNFMEVYCSLCGRQNRVAIKPIADAIKASRLRNFDIRRYSLFLYGECKVCRKRKRKE